MNFLITGGCGFLGSNLASEVIARGEQLCIFDNMSRLGAASNLDWLSRQGTFRLVQEDIREADAVVSAVADFKPDAVFHLAGQVTMTQSIADPWADFNINAGGTVNLLEAVRRFAPEAVVIFSSTNKVYGDLQWVRYEESPRRYLTPDHPRGFDESTPLDFRSPYGCSKGAADQYMLDYARIFGLRTIVFRHSSMYGSRQFSSFDQGWIGWFCQKAIEAKQGLSLEPFTINHTGKQVRDVLHATDMIRLYFSALERVDQGQGLAFNIGGGMAQSLSLLELFDLLEELLDVELKFTRTPPRESDQQVFVADIGRAQKAFGWKPQVSARAGIEKMLQWSADVLSESGDVPLAVAENLR